jgi:hypothetical protein
MPGSGIRRSRAHARIGDVRPIHSGPAYSLRNSIGLAQSHTRSVPVIPAGEGQEMVQIRLQMSDRYDIEQL